MSKERERERKRGWEIKKGKEREEKKERGGRETGYTCTCTLLLHCCPATPMESLMINEIFITD